MTKPTLQTATWLEDDLRALQTDPTFVSEGIILAVCESIHRALAAQQLKASDLATRLKISKSAVSQMLSGDQNISLRRLVEVALALGMTVSPPQLIPLDLPVVEAAEQDGCYEVDLGSVDPALTSDLLVALWSNLGDEPDTVAERATAVPYNAPLVALNSSHPVPQGEAQAEPAANDYSYALGA